MLEHCTVEQSSNSTWRYTCTKWGGHGGLRCCGEWGWKIAVLRWSQTLRCAVSTLFFVRCTVKRIFLRCCDFKVPQKCFIAFFLKKCGDSVPSNFFAVLRCWHIYFLAVLRCTRPPNAPLVVCNIAWDVSVVDISVSANVLQQVSGPCVGKMLEWCCLY